MDWVKEAVSVISAIGSVVSGGVAVFFFIYFWRIKRMPDYWEQLSKAQKEEHRYPQNLVMRVKGEKAAIELLDELVSESHRFRNLVAKLVTKQKEEYGGPNYPMWEYWNIGIPNYFRKLDLITKQLEVAYLAEHCAQNKLPDLALSIRLERAKNELLELAKNTGYVD